MFTTILMCQQGIPFRVSPARTQMIEELNERESEVIVFFPGRVEELLKKRITKSINTAGVDKKDIIRIIKKINPNIVICFTIEDIKICFSLPYLMKNTDFYYYNLEIYVPHINKKNFCSIIISKLNYLENKFKEILFVKGCKGFVIQDKLRKNISKKYWISHSNTWLIANSYYNDNQQYQLSSENGLIYSGSVGKDVLGTFIEKLNSFSNIKITIAGWNRPEIRFKENSNIKIIKHNLTQEKYTDFIKKFSIALIWYSDRKDNDDNVYYIGLASGKFFKHLSMGQPVIVNNVPGLSKVVKKYKLGLVIDELSELECAVQHIRSNYNFYVENIRKVYSEKFDYKKISKSFYDYITDKAQKL